MERHEARCYRNPKRACERCSNKPEHAVGRARRHNIANLAEKGKPIAAVDNECPDCLMALCIRATVGGDYAAWYQREQYQKDCQAWHEKHPRLYLRSMTFNDFENGFDNLHEGGKEQ